MGFKEIKIWDSSQEKNVPSGYEFVRSGNHFLTITMKKLCRDQKVCIYSRMARGPNYSFATGYFVPRNVAQEAEKRRILTAAQREKNRIKAAAYRAKREEKYIEEFRLAIAKQFPGLPDIDVDAVSNRACEVGSERVGRTKHLSLDEKVKLAVAAHARHKYTCYEELLGEYCTDDEYRNIRHHIAPEVDSILESWQLGNHVSVEKMAGACHSEK